MRNKIIATLGTATASIVLAVGPAAAHHVADGAMPTTAVEGLLSGLAHPVIGIDHLAFIAAIGIAAALLGGGFGLIAAFIAGSTVGVLGHVAALDIPLVEPLVAASVVVAGAALVAGWTRAPLGWLAFAGIAGVLHGYAFGESVVGAERAVVGAYLVGLALIQFAIAVAAMVLARQFLSPGAITAPIRAAGVIVAAVGVFLLVGGLTGA